MDAKLSKYFSDFRIYACGNEYSELPNKRADQNKRIWREYFLIYHMKNESLVDFLICYIKDWKYDIFFFPKKAKRVCSFIRKIRVMHDLVIVSSISSNGQNMTTCSLFRSLPTSTRPN